MENINALDEISKGSCMGVDAIDFVLEKVEDNELKKTLEIERNKYKDIFKKLKIFIQSTMKVRFIKLE